MYNISEIIRLFTTDLLIYSKSNRRCTETFYDLMILKHNWTTNQFNEYYTIFINNIDNITTKTN